MLFKEFEEKIVIWWNSNAFLGYTVENIHDVIMLFRDSNFKTIKEMLDWYQKEANDFGMNMNYYKDLAESFECYFHELEKNQKDIDPDILDIVNDNFWDLLL